MRRTIAALAGAFVLVTGCSGGGGVDADSAAANPASAPAELSVAPEDGATDVPPSAPLEIDVTEGELAEVTLVAADGTPVAGEVEDGAPAVWTPEQPLSYGTSYTLTATAMNAADEETEATATFTVVTPDSVVTPAVGPLDGTTVGVGMPIRVWFDAPVTEKAAVERRLTVTSTEPTDGAWNWFSDTEVHFRPSEYWPENIDVTLEADLYGVHLGNGVWGEKDRTIAFTVGERHVSVVDAAAHSMQVYDGEVLVKTFPISAGSPQSPSRNGPHVVSDFQREMVMDSSTYGVPVDSPDGYRTEVEYAVRLNDNGEFVHAAPWSVAQQGSQNVSHGCVNLSTERAAWFYDFSQPGDIVEIENSTGPALSAADGAIYDWTIPWDEWRAGSALK